MLSNSPDRLRKILSLLKDNEITPITFFDLKEIIE
jgi:hypothetical protein